MKFTELPRACPQCQREFSSVIRPQSRLQAKAVSLLGIATLVTMVWGGLVLFGWFQIIPLLGGLRLSVLTFVLALALAFAPGGWLGQQALNLPKVVGLGCRGCGWSETFLLDNR